MSSDTLSLNLKIWRQAATQKAGRFETYTLTEISTHASFLEMLDILNEKLTKENKDPIAFDHDCREGICGMCGAIVNGQPHGPLKETTLCQLHMRHFKSGDTIVIEPFRSKAFPILKDLAIDRSAFDRVIQAGGYISVKTGGTPDANAIPIAKEIANKAMDAAQCIGCGACVAACPNASAMLFVSAKINHLNQLPQGKVEKENRTYNMVHAMDHQGFGNCSNEYLCEAACPKAISVENIAAMNKEFLNASLKK